MQCSGSGDLVEFILQISITRTVLQLAWKLTIETGLLRGLSWMDLFIAEICEIKSSSFGFGKLAKFHSVVL